MQKGILKEQQPRRKKEDIISLPGESRRVPPPLINLTIEAQNKSNKLCIFEKGNSDKKGDMTSNLSCFFRLHSCVLIQHFQPIFFCLFNYRTPSLYAQRSAKINIVKVPLVFHAFKILLISYNKGIFARFPCFKLVSFFCAVTNVWHGNIISKSTTNAAIDTSWLPPAFWNSEKSVALVSNKPFQAFLFLLGVLNLRHC